MVVEAPFVYNFILGKVALNQTRDVVSTYSLVVKFPTPHGVGSMQGDQATTRYCYVNSLWRNTVLESLNVEELDLRDDTDRVTLVEELEPVVLDDEFLD